VQRDPQVGPLGLERPQPFAGAVGRMVIDQDDFLGEPARQVHRFDA
jgi:hypothetical protein